MKKAICSFIYYKLLGWKTKVSAPDYDKYIICAAPHTTNWDLFIGKLVFADAAQRADPIFGDVLPGCAGG